MFVFASVFAVIAAANPMPVQFSFTLWDWEPGYTDMDQFRRQVDACAAHGFTQIELGVGWHACEPEQGRFEFSAVSERLEYIESKGLAIRLRVNVLDVPPWFSPDLSKNPDGSDFSYRKGVPSIFSFRNREAQMAFVAAAARHFEGKGYTYSPGFSVHMEVKFGAWNTYEPAARDAFRLWLAGQYQTIEALNATWKSAFTHFDGVQPPVPNPTHGEPDLSQANGDWIRFREFSLAHYVQGFAATVRSADPTARISVPLGESFRRESAAFANLAYQEYARAADEVVHSYDFFWHGPDARYGSREAVAVMAGIAGKPVVFEIDGPYLIDQHGYARERLTAMAQEALHAGAAGIQVSNWGSTPIAGESWLADIGNAIRAMPPVAPTETSSRSTCYYYLSKWQNYLYREDAEWLAEKQMALLSELLDRSISVRVVTDANLLSEPINASAMVIPWAPVMDAPVRERLAALSYGMRIIAADKPGVYTTTAKTNGQFGAKMDAPEDGLVNPDHLAELIRQDDARRYLRVAAVQFLTEFDVDRNLLCIESRLREAAQEGARVVVFSEMALTGYSKSATFLSTFEWEAVDRAMNRIRDCCRELNLYAIVGAPFRNGDAVHCGAIAIGPDGTILDQYAKIQLAGEKWATPGTDLSTFEIDGVKCATIICHDERYPELVQLRALAGVQLFFYISCESGVLEEHKIDPYRAQIQARAAENSIYFVCANAPADPSAPERHDTSHGQSRIVSPDGGILAEAPVYGDAMIVAGIRPDAASDTGRERSITEGPLKDWMRQGMQSVR
ncbi:MAG: hypothetical protein AMXMBFR84_22980 [Candidatus Hydrogenedentota bacterium]